VRQYFERHAETFDLLYSEDRQSAFMRWVNRRFRRDIAERFLQTLDCAARIRAKSILDVGCGSGRYLAAFAELGIPRMVGIDLSIAMLHLARTMTVPYLQSRIDLVLADFDKWQTDEMFDLVVAMGLFDYIADPSKTLVKMRSHAGSCVIASFPSRHWFRTPLRKVRYRVRDCPLYVYDERSIRALAESAGFAKVELRKVPGAGMDYVVSFYCNAATSSPAA
jgi:predicted TPR repeat methyltransferase